MTFLLAIWLGIMGNLFHASVKEAKRPPVWFLKLSTDEQRAVIAKRFAVYKEPK